MKVLCDCFVFFLNKCTSNNFPGIKSYCFDVLIWKAFAKIVDILELEVNPE